MKSRQLLFAFQLITTATFIGCSKDEPTEPPTNDVEYGLSGSITGPENEGVVVLVGQVQTNSNSEGDFELAGLLPGSYQVTPSKNGFYFEPESRKIDIIDESIGNIDFEIFSEGDLQYNGGAWEFFKNEVYTIKQNEGNLIQLDLAQNALWFQNDQGGLIYQTVTGDFEIQGRVSARKRTNDQEEVECAICLGGLMARDPENTSGENYVHLVTGNTPEGIGVEHKTTVDGQSDFDATNDGTADFDLRMVRVGNDFTLSKKSPGSGDWVEVITYSRPDLPATLQVGFNIYTAASGELADLTILYENVVISQ